ncbi:MAG: stage IV sporulation protein A [Clostridia bacterium]|nr:stage IV sporulation protein A [Clostridia bacterium]
MGQHTIYRDIAERTGGNIYIGVVGPVRTGKSTFVRRFAEEMLLPNIREERDRLRTLDSLPQAGNGRSVMTTEPKFIPDEAVGITPDGVTRLNVRLVDCVGFPVPDVLGMEEDGSPRMVSTPWSDDPLPFSEAAEVGTRKVIAEHSTICMLVTSDGSFGEIPRENYVAAEESAAAELAGRNRPYAIILNSADPSNEDAVKLAYDLEKKYNAPVALVNCTRLDREDLSHILGLVLSEFATSEVRFRLPSWISALEEDHPIRRSLFDAVARISEETVRMGDLSRLEEFAERLPEGADGATWSLTEQDAGTGRALIDVMLPRETWFDVLREKTGLSIRDEGELLAELTVLAKAKEKWDRVEPAFRDCEAKGYGVVLPEASELRLEDPKIVKQSGGYGVRLRAAARSIHLISADIETEINPVVGTEEQSEELVRYLTSGMEDDPGAVWNTNLFGKSLYDLTSEGIHSKLSHLPDESRERFAETLERIINEGSSGLICILL